MIILGIDPGYATVGYGVIEADGMHFRTVDYGAVTTPANTPFDIRLEMIYDGEYVSFATDISPMLLPLKNCFSTQI